MYLFGFYYIELTNKKDYNNYGKCWNTIKSKKAKEWDIFSLKLVLLGPF